MKKTKRCLKYAFEIVATILLYMMIVYSFLMVEKIWTAHEEDKRFRMCTDYVIKRLQI